ncbi:MAG: hypothetical protein R3E01_06085 [Pirellulaceae bacterium]
MIHHTCDRCKRIIDPESDVRYVVRLEVRAVMDPIDMDEDENDRDHLLELHEILERCDDEDCDEISEEIYQSKRFDLCPACHRKFLKNPVGRESVPHLGFSQN